MIRMVKYAPNYRHRAFNIKKAPRELVASFVDWYNHQHRHNSIKFVIPYQRHNGDAAEICSHRAVVSEQARQCNPGRCSGTTRCWRQREVVWINPPSLEIELNSATFDMAA